VLNFTIYNSSENETACVIVKNIWFRISGMFIQLFSNPKQGKTTIQEHEIIIEALSVRDEKKAIYTLGKHLAINRSIL